MTFALYIKLTNKKNQNSQNSWNKNNKRWKHEHFNIWL